METTLRCPHCYHETVYDEDCTDVDSWLDKNVEYHSGYCLNCKAIVEWKRVYVFVGYEDIKEIKESQANA